MRRALVADLVNMRHCVVVVLNSYDHHPMMMRPGFSNVPVECSREPV